MTGSRKPRPAVALTIGWPPLRRSESAGERNVPGRFACRLCASVQTSRWAEPRYPFRSATLNQREETSGPATSAWRTTACSNEGFGVGFFGGVVSHNLRIRSRKRVQPGWVLSAFMSVSFSLVRKDARAGDRSRCADQHTVRCATLGLTGATLRLETI